MVTATCSSDILNSCSYYNSAVLIILWENTSNDIPSSYIP
uniref:Uncharacterized protein n=1 Tax=Arundo donax TaxID=35708 RepID=A0A0A9A825_ARUDO